MSTGIVCKTGLRLNFLSCIFLNERSKRCLNFSSCFKGDEKGKGFITFIGGDVLSEEVENGVLSCVFSRKFKPV